MVDCGKQSRAARCQTSLGADWCRVTHSTDHFLGQLGTQKHSKWLLCITFVVVRSCTIAFIADLNGSLVVNCYARMHSPIDRWHIHFLVVTIQLWCLRSVASHQSMTNGLGQWLVKWVGEWKWSSVITVFDITRHTLWAICQWQFRVVHSSNLIDHLPTHRTLDLVLSLIAIFDLQTS